MKKNEAFILTYFAVLKWDECLYVKPIAIWVQIPDQILLKLEPNWLDQNVNEIEFELPISRCRWNDPKGLVLQLFSSMGAGSPREY